MTVGEPQAGVVHNEVKVLLVAWVDQAERKEPGQGRGGGPRPTPTWGFCKGRLPIRHQIHGDLVDVVPRLPFHNDEVGLGHDQGDFLWRKAKVFHAQRW